MNEPVRTDEETPELVLEARNLHGGEPHYSVRSVGGQPVNVGIHGHTQIGVGLGDRGGEFRQMRRRGFGIVRKLAAQSTTQQGMAHAQTLEQGRHDGAAGALHRIDDHMQIPRSDHAAIQPGQRHDGIEVALVGVGVQGDRPHPIPGDMTVLGIVALAHRRVLSSVQEQTATLEQREETEDAVARRLGFISWAPVLRISAKTGARLHRLAKTLDVVTTNRARRLSTGKLNRLVREWQAAHPPPVRKGRRPHILYAVQAGAEPPTIVIFVGGGVLGEDYLRYIENRIRGIDDFIGTPVKVVARRRIRKPEDA